MNDLKRELQRTMSLTDVNTSSSIRDVVERDLTVPADRKKHRFFLNLPKHDLILPSLSRFDADFRKFLLSVLVDFPLLRHLEEARRLNWCAALRKFLPLLTLADGNCLMNAASLSMWAINDRRLTLRKSVYQILIEDESDIFKNRWQLEQAKRFEEQHGSAVDCSEEEWLRDWKNTIELAATKRSPDTNCFSGLEEIHVFALANVLRRPIIVLCDDILRGNYDESLADVNMGGLYLPLQCDSVDCVKSPLLIGYHQGHFTALVTTEDGSINVSDEEEILGERTKNAVPLVNSDGSPMKIHFLLSEERQHSDRLLREYVDCSRVEHAGNEGQESILVAVMKSQEPELHLDQMFKTYFDALQAVYLEKLDEKLNSSSSSQRRNGQFVASQRGNTPIPPAVSCAPRNTIPPHTEVPTSSAHAECCNDHKRCQTAGCKYYTTKAADAFCYRCKEDEKQLCTSPGCSFTANPDYQGLCSRCYTRYHALLQQEQTMARPSAPLPSLCQTESCQEPGNSELHHLCVQCYLWNIKEMGAEMPTGGSPVNWTTGESQLPRPPTMAASYEDISQEQVLNKEVPGRKMVSATASPIPRISRQVSLFCANQNCHNHLRNSASPYCSDCVEIMAAQIPFNSAVKTCKSPGCGGAIPSGSSNDLCNHCLDGFQAATTSQQPSVISSRKSKFEICSVHGCMMPAVTYHGELCLAHYQESQHHHQTNCEHHNHSIHDSKATLCINPGCNFYGNPESNYLCSNCHSKALQELYELEKSKEGEMRAKVEWFNRNYMKMSSHPNHQLHQFDDVAHGPRKTFYLQTSSSSQTSTSAPPSPNPRRKWSAKTNPCVTQGCPHFGTEEKKGLCDICFKKLETVLHHNSNSGRSRFCSSP